MPYWRICLMKRSDLYCPPWSISAERPRSKALSCGNEGPVLERKPHEIDHMVGQMGQVAHRLVVDLAVLTEAAAEQARLVHFALVVPRRRDDMNRASPSSCRGYRHVPGPRQALWVTTLRTGNSRFPMTKHPPAARQERAFRAEASRPRPAPRPTWGANIPRSTVGGYGASAWRARSSAAFSLISCKSRTISLQPYQLV